MKDEKYFIDKLSAEKAAEINEDKPLVVFLDGRGITGNHKTFNLMTGAFQKAMVKAALGAAGGEECLVYATLDEVSMIFPKPKNIISHLEYKTNDEVIATILQDFVSVFWKKFGDYVRFHGYVFNLEDGDEEDYVKWRYRRSRHAIYTYTAKENHVYADYGKMTEEEMKELLKKNYLWEGLKANTDFFRGTCVRANARSN